MATDHFTQQKLKLAMEETDSLQRFLLENTDVRGEWIHLDTAWREILNCADYPAGLRQILGQAAAAVCLMSATIKFEGSLILQINSHGPVSMLVMQATSDGQIRGLAQWQKEDQEQNHIVNTSHDLKQLFNEGQMVISIINDKEQDRYQGIVSLEGDTLAECLQAYFEQSEQLQTRIHLAADDKTAAGLLIQSLPQKDYDQAIKNDSDGWDRAVSLTDTLTPEELLQLQAKTLLHRLFHQEELRLFEPQTICYQCSCSQQKIENMIRSLGQKEAQQITEEQQQIEIHCDFCNKKYSLDSIDVAALFDQQIIDADDSIH